VKARERERGKRLPVLYARGELEGKDEKMKREGASDRTATVAKAKGSGVQIGENLIKVRDSERVDDEDEEGAVPYDDKRLRYME